MAHSRATECETCLGVANGGRIRVTESRAERVEGLLRDQRRGLLIVRRAAIDGGDSETAGIANEDIREIDILLEEIARTQAEKGWRTSHGEPERPHT